METPAGKTEPCEGLASLAKITTQCAAEMPAGEFAGMLAVSLSHGNPIEAQIMRQLLGK